MELEELVRARNQAQTKDSRANARVTTVEDKINIKLSWRDGKKAPCEMFRPCDAVVLDNTVYCQHDYDNKKIYAYHTPSSSWSMLLDHPLSGGIAFAIIDGLLTTVGGKGRDSKETNKLFSLGSGSRWTEKFPPMPTKRAGVSALCNGTALIVAGGTNNLTNPLKTVEVLNIETQQWHTAPDLPEPLSQSSLTLCGDVVYLLGGFKQTATNSVHSCSLNSLLELPSVTVGPDRRRIWNRIADLPVRFFATVILHGRLLAIGGLDSEDKCTRAVHM